jgi:hypothetical protein
MSNKRTLKKDINFVYSELIEAVYLSQISKSGEKSGEKVEELVDDIIASFDNLIEKLNQKNIENAKTHFKAIRSEAEAKSNEVVEKINAL